MGAVLVSQTGGSIRITVPLIPHGPHLQSTQQELSSYFPFITARLNTPLITSALLAKFTLFHLNHTHQKVVSS